MCQNFKKKIRRQKVKTEAAENCMFGSFVYCVVATHDQLPFSRHCCSNWPLNIAASWALLSQKCNNARFSITFKVKPVINSFYVNLHRDNKTLYHFFMSYKFINISICWVMPMGTFLVLRKGLYTLTLSPFPAMELNKCSIREMGRAQDT